jgi:hypothetical protein
MTADATLPTTTGQKANGHRKAGPGPDWPALPERGLRNEGRFFAQLLSLVQKIHS